MHAIQLKLIRKVAMRELNEIELASVFGAGFWEGVGNAIDNPFTNIDQFLDKLGNEWNEERANVSNAPDLYSTEMRALRSA